MSDTRMDGWNNLLNLLVIATGISIFPFYESLGLPNMSPVLERYLLYGLTFVATVAHLHYAVSVVSIFFALTSQALPHEYKDVESASKGSNKGKLKNNINRMPLKRINICRRF